MRKRHFWKKNPTNFFKSGFRGVTQRHFWKKIQNILMDLYSIIMKIFSFRGITQRHLSKKIPRDWIFFPEMTLGYSPELTHSKKLKINGQNYVIWIFFPEMTLSNSPIWVWIFFPKMTLGHSPEKSYNFSLNLDIFYW